ncbi:MAG TPA: ArsA-related P-loop ATPase [Acidimicrobiales bacterium]|nr:ArsA-related P-loop ATPase [Acidimicrobiales bacterium]
MDPGAFLAQARLLIVAGKGGVGKTTVSAALARTAALAGLTTLIVEVEGKSGLGTAFGHGHDLTYQETVLAPAGEPKGAGEVRARTLTPDDALLEYLEDHGMRRISKRLASSGALDVVATAAPGIKDILVLGKVKQLERASASGLVGAPDFLILDTPAAGHAVTFLMSAHGLLDAVTVGPIRSQAAEVIELLSDARRCQVILVTLPEETPVNEVVETAFQLEDRVGVHLAPVVVNGLYPVLEHLDADPMAAAGAAGVRLTSAEADALRDAAAFRRHRQDLQETQLHRLADALPLAQIHLPFLFTTEPGPVELDLLATALAGEIQRLEPDEGTRPGSSGAGGSEGGAREGGGRDGEGGRAAAGSDGAGGTGGSGEGGTAGWPGAAEAASS